MIRFCKITPFKDEKMQTLSDKAKENKLKYIHKYNKEKYKRIALNVSPDKFQQIKDHATSCGESVNGYIKKAIDERLKKEL